MKFTKFQSVSIILGQLIYKIKTKIVVPKVVF